MPDVLTLVRRLRGSLRSTHLTYPTHQP